MRWEKVISVGKRSWSGREGPASVKSSQFLVQYSVSCHSFSLRLLPSTLCRILPAASLSAFGDDSLHSNVFHRWAVQFGLYQRCYKSCCIPALSQRVINTIWVRPRQHHLQLSLENKIHVQTTWKTRFYGLFLFYRSCQKLIQEKFVGCNLKCNHHEIKLCVYICIQKNTYPEISETSLLLFKEGYTNEKSAFDYSFSLHLDCSERDTGWALKATAQIHLIPPDESVIR